MIHNKAIFEQFVPIEMYKEIVWNRQDHVETNWNKSLRVLM